MTIALHCTFAPNDDDAALFALAKEVGYESVEPLAPRGPASGADPVQWPTEAESRAAVSVLRRLRDASGVRIDTVYGGGLWVLRDEDQPARAEQDVACFSRLIPMLAEECGTRVITVNLAGTLMAPGVPYMELDRHGSAVATEVHYQRGAEALHSLGEVAARVGMAIGVEMHPVSLADSAATALRLVEMAKHPAVGITWDMGNFIRMGRAEPWGRQLDILFPHIVSVHLKNGLSNKEGWRRSTLEFGAMEDMAAQVQTLRDWGYRGALVVEAPGLKSGQREMAQTDLAFLKNNI